MSIILVVVVVVVVMMCACFSLVVYLQIRKVPLSTFLTLTLMT
jgi:hypothetical protein